MTADFNKNVLAVLNAELSADFDLDAFEHVAVWDPEREWIEMRLRSTAVQHVLVRDLGLTVTFADGEEMRTEVSAKFRRAGVEAELGRAGFTMRSWWTDPAGQLGCPCRRPPDRLDLFLFSVVLTQCRLAWVGLVSGCLACLGLWRRA